MKKDWFRRTVWSTQDAQEFEEALLRSRPGKRPQYLRIQAAHLADSSVDAPALQLLERILSDFPDDYFIAQVHSQRGDILVRLGKVDEAIQAYRDAMNAQREKPNCGTNAYLNFAWLVATTSRKALFSEAIKVLEEFGEAEPFPIQQFLHLGSKAIIHSMWGNSTQAADFARKALLAMNAQDSGFRYHNKVGLARGIGPDLITRLETIAAS
jgi:tetratricopeptide (TPR) repeat protein